MTTEWMPRTCIRAEERPAEQTDAVLGFSDGGPTPVMQALLDALEPFADARRAVAEALSRFVRRDRGRDSS